MSVAQGAFWRDQNHVPITTDGLQMVSNSIVLSGNNTTVATPIFSITGSVEVRALYGVVTTALGTNQTAAAWRLNDSAAQSDISLNTGTTVSARPAGSVLTRRGLVSVALVAISSATEAVSDPVNANIGRYFTSFIAVQKAAGVTTNIEYVYATTDTPTTGAITFYLRYLPLSSDANVTAV